MCVCECECECECVGQVSVGVLISDAVLGIVHNCVVHCCVH